VTAPASGAGLLFLIGYRGTGKTATARLVAERLGCAWCDADALLEERFGRTIRQIFADEGEAGFRAKETLVLEELAARRQHVIATGGGIILRPENRERLRQGHVVWLTAPAAVLWQRLQSDASTAERRPNLARGGLAEIEELIALRTPLYQECANFTIDTAAQTPAQVAEAIAGWVERL
jgi:shikimate kinase